MKTKYDKKLSDMTTKCGIYLEPIVNV